MRPPRAAGRSILQPGRADNGPIESGLPHRFLLLIVISQRLGKKNLHQLTQRNRKLLPRITRTQGRLDNKPTNPGLPHRRNNGPCHRRAGMFHTLGITHGDHHSISTRNRRAGDLSIRRATDNRRDAIRNVAASRHRSHIMTRPHRRDS